MKKRIIGLGSLIFILFLYVMIVGWVLDKENVREEEKQKKSYELGYQQGIIDCWEQIEEEKIPSK